MNKNILQINMQNNKNQNPIIYIIEHKDLIEERLNEYVHVIVTLSGLYNS